MHKLFKDDEDARIIKKMLMSLPLLPANRFESGYNYIVNLTKEWKLSKKFESFFKYFKKQWVVQVVFLTRSYSKITILLNSI